MKPLYVHKILALLLVFIFSLQGVSLFASAEDIPAARERSQIVRVALTRLGITDRMDLTLKGGFRVAADEIGEVYLPNGSKVTVLLKENRIYLYADEITLRAGQNLQLERIQEDGGFYLTNFPAMYLGNLNLDIADGKLRPILSIHVEDYLLGVVPYEMSDSFPLEALKAQAVAARTYALRRQNSAAPYDVIDTTNDQVFKGYIAGNAQAERAVAETRGVCGFFKGELAQCFYSASNGGQMELVETVWPERGNYGYYTFAEDPYDIENPQSVVRSFDMLKRYTESAPYVLRKYLSEALTDQLASLGYDTEPDSIQVDEILSVTADTPVKAGDKRMTMLNLSLKISGRTRGHAVSVRIVDEDVEEVSLFGEPAPTPGPTEIPAVISPDEPQINYGPFVPIEQEMLLKIPIFPDAEDAFGMDISPNYENEIWQVVEKEDRFILEARRYGHGVGMSQRGAQWMAGAYEKDYQEILGFYYPGMDLMRYPDQPALLAKLDAALAETVGPAPTPTPRPTLMPMTLSAKTGEWKAEVTEIAEDSSLNLRSEPSLNGKIVMRLYKGQQLLVTEQCAEEGWVRVLTDTAEGYVMEKYLTKMP